MRTRIYSHGRTAVVVIASIMLVFGMAAFGGGQAEEVDPADVEQNLVVAQLSDAVSLDPHGSNDSPSSNVRTQIYDTLVYFDEEMELQAGLATDWEAVDETTWRFTLREGVTFHDGEPFNAEAVQASLERVSDEEFGSERYFLYDMITEVNVVDEYTVDVVTEYPFAPILSHLAHDGGGMISPAAVEEAGYDEVEPIGTGPFMLESWEPGDELVLVRNDNYWGDPVNLDSITFQVVPEESTRLALVETGDAHVAQFEQPANQARVEGAQGMDLMLYDSLSLDYIGMNTEREPYDDILVRQAISMAIDRETMVDGILEGAGIPAIGPLSPLVFGFSDDVDTLEYDPDGARELLAEAGYEDGFETTLWTNDNARRMEIAEIVQNDLADIGIDVQIEVLEWGAYLDETAEGNHDMFILGWVTVTGDADYGLYALFHSDNHGAVGNRSFYSNDEVDALLDEGRLEPDMEERRRIYAEVQNALVPEAPHINLYHPRWMVAVNEAVENYNHHPDNMMLLDEVIITQ